MKLSLKIFTLFIGAILSISMMDSKDDFHVTISQDGKEIEIVNHVVHLDKSEFAFVIDLSEPMGLLVNGSFIEHNYQMALNGDEIDKLPGFSESGMAEYRNNVDTEMFIANDAPSYWHYSNDEDNRFDKVEKSGGHIICTRTINNLYLLKDTSTPSIGEVEEPIYLVFISYEKGEGFYDRIEHKREMIKIE